MHEAVILHRQSSGNADHFQEEGESICFPWPPTVQIGGINPQSHLPKRCQSSLRSPAHPERDQPAGAGGGRQKHTQRSAVPLAASSKGTHWLLFGQTVFCNPVYFIKSTQAGLALSPCSLAHHTLWHEAVTAGFGFSRCDLAVYNPLMNHDV